MLFFISSFICILTLTFDSNLDYNMNIHLLPSSGIIRKITQGAGIVTLSLFLLVVAVSHCRKLSCWVGANVNRRRILNVCCEYSRQVCLYAVGN